MPYSFDYDPADKILAARVSGYVNRELIHEFYREATALIAVTDLRGSFVDLSKVVTFDVSADEIHELATFPPADPLQARPRVCIAPLDRVYGLVRMFGIWGEATRPNFHVVRTFREAYAILQLANPKFYPRE